MTARILRLRRSDETRARDVRRILARVQALASAGLTGTVPLEDAVFEIDAALRPAVREALAGPIGERRPA